MTERVADIIAIMEEVAPARLAEDWDNAGLQVGRKDWPVSRIWVALDPLPEVVSAACEAQTDLLITHHPLIFGPVKSVDFDTPLGAVIRKAACHRLSIFSAHTNLDSVKNGINDVLASRIGVKAVRVLGHESEPGSGEGIGRVGMLNEQTTLKSLALNIRQALGLSAIKFSGPPELAVDTVALCSGSGSGLMGNFFSSGAQVYISGDLRYHDARDAEALGLGLIDIGHFASEHLMTEVLTERLRAAVTARGMTVTVDTCGLEHDPFAFL